MVVNKSFRGCAAIIESARLRVVVVVRGRVAPFILFRGRRRGGDMVNLNSGAVDDNRERHKLNDDKGTLVNTVTHPARSRGT